MGYLDIFVIPFSGLKTGKHEFDLKIGPAFFECFEYSEIKEGTADVHVVLMRSERMLDFTFHITGQVLVPCDRCGDPLNIGITATERLIVKLGEDYAEESDAVLIIPESVTSFDVSPHIYDYIHLVVPGRRIHPVNENGVSGCNPEVLRKLDELQTRHSADPRWEALNKLRKINTDS